MDIKVFLLAVAIVVVGVMVFVAIALTGKRGHSFDKEKYQSDFLSIENNFIKSNPASYSLTVISADKLLDKALMEFGFPGKTMGDRLKHAGSKFTKPNSVWHAHKMRNAIAHEHGFSVSYAEAQHALAAFKQALKDLGAI